MGPPSPRTARSAEGERPPITDRIASVATRVLWQPQSSGSFPEVWYGKAVDGPNAGPLAGWSVIAAVYPPMAGCGASIHIRAEKPGEEPIQVKLGPSDPPRFYETSSEAKAVVEAFVRCEGLDDVVVGESVTIWHPPAALTEWDGRHAGGWPKIVHDRSTPLMLPHPLRGQR